MDKREVFKDLEKGRLSFSNPSQTKIEVNFKASHRQTCLPQPFQSQKIEVSSEVSQIDRPKICLTKPFKTPHLKAPTKPTLIQPWLLSPTHTNMNVSTWRAAVHASTLNRCLTLYIYARLMLPLQLTSYRQKSKGIYRFLNTNDRHVARVWCWKVLGNSCGWRPQYLINSYGRVVTVTWL